MPPRLHAFVNITKDAGSNYWEPAASILLKIGDEVNEWDSLIAP